MDNENTGREIDRDGQNELVAVDIRTWANRVPGFVARLVDEILQDADGHDVEGRLLGSVEGERARHPVVRITQP